MPIPDLSNKPGPGRPGWSAGTYDFQFQVTGAVTIKAQPAATGTFTIKWPNGTEVTTAGSNSIAAPDGTAGVVSINKTTDTTYADKFAVVGGQTNVSKVLSWGANPWSLMSNCFKDCTSLSDISTTKFIASAGANIVKMFAGCTSLLEADIKNWDLTAGVNWYGGSPFSGLVNLQKLDMTGMVIKLTARSDNAFSNIGSATTDGCELLMSNIDWSTTASNGIYTVYWFTSVRFKNTSDLSGWNFPSSGWAGTGMFNGAKIIGTDAVLNVSNWTTYSGTLFPSFSSFNGGLGNTGAKINLTNFGMSNVNSMDNSFYYTDISKIIGLNTWGATAGGVNMFRTFFGSDHLSFSDNDNFSNTFIESLTPTRMDQTFMNVGSSSSNGVAPNISNIDLSNCTTTSQLFSNARFTNVPDLASATFSSTNTILMPNTFSGMRISDADSHVDFSNTAVKISNAAQMFSSAHIDKVTFGNNVDFSGLTTVTNMFYFPGTPIEVKFPTNADFSSLTSTGNWFAGLVGPTTGPLTTCQIDNLIRRFRATAYNSALNVNFYNGQITEAPSVVRTLEAELVSNGWTITENATDATLPFAYPSYVFDSEVTQSVTPTTVPAGGQFSSTDPGATVDQNTGVVSWANGFMGTPVIRCTYADGCYNEVQMSMLVTVDNNYSMEFDGTSSYIDCGDSDSFSFGDGTNDSPFSISVWVNMDVATRFRIINKYNINNPKEWLFAVGGDNTLRLNLYDNSNQNYIGKKSASTLTSYEGQWIHLACSYDGSSSVDGVKLYLNGSRLGETDNSSGGYVAMENSTQPVLIGHQGNDYANGKIDEVAVFSRELTPAQIKLIYDANSTNKSIKLSSLPGGAPVAWYRMGD